MYQLDFPWLLLILPAPLIVWWLLPPHRETSASIRLPFFNEIARAAGVAKEATVLDPGFGFAKDTDENLELMAHFGALYGFGAPMVVGTSRKRFVGAVTGREGDTRDIGTAATTALLRMAGAAVFRVHDVALNRDALAMADAMLAAGRRVAAQDRTEE